MSISKHITVLLSIAAFALCAPLRAAASEHGGEKSEEKGLAIGDIITEHISDSYWWHITTWSERHISVYLPVIVRSDNGGWHVFSSKHLAHGEPYEGFRIAEKGAKHEGKVVAVNAAGEAYRPWDISITKNALALMINSAIMLAIFLSVARWYRRRPKNSTPSKFVCAVEMFVMDVEEEIVRTSIGKDYKRYSPYLLTAFFFILINNVMGIIPIFPGGANTTGNIAITCVLALCTMVAVNLFGNREYWREIFWPDVPLLLKAPIPLMPLIEFFGVITKPFALMIRLLANIFAGHTVILAFTLLIFITAKLSVGIFAGMTFFSIVLSLIMNCLELLVAYIQAYVFTLLSAVFIGLSRPEHHVAKKQG
ncbi:MAG: F0F1 ATP synthase subunit A [Prevotellaceae bacterium]|jgi:F-type H+-transporting ATPase subunit a|nr:F0F1 ATP synthase subunit A [Prevotellaceae bacterium]